MDGLTDVHCHLIPYVDDGAENLEEAVALLELQAQQGVTKVYLTPHLRKDMFETTQEKVEVQFQRLQEIVHASPDFPQIALGRENHCDENFKKLLRCGKALPLGESRYLLMEFSSRHTREDMQRYVAAAQDAGYLPVIAHAERYPCVQKDAGTLPALVEAGAWIQINAGSVLGREGWTQKRLCARMLKSRLVHLVASDAHHVDYRPPNLGECARYLTKKLDSAYAKQILYENPKAINGK